MIVENFLLNNKKITSRTGDIKKLSWRKTRNFSGTSEERAYKEYSYYVKGSNDIVLTRTRLYKPCAENNCIELMFIE